MKILNISLMKLIIRLTVLLIFFVILFMLLTILYSSRYWPDVYNYINANITIKRIPTLSELNLTILEVDLTTELYATEDYIEASTVDGMNDEVNIDKVFDDLISFETKRSKRGIPIEDFEHNEINKSNRDFIDIFKETERKKKDIFEAKYEFNDFDISKDNPMLTLHNSDTMNKRVNFEDMDAARECNNIMNNEVIEYTDKIYEVLVNKINKIPTIDIINNRINNRNPKYVETREVNHENIENLENDYVELPKTNVDYFFIEEPTTVHEGVVMTKIIKDLITESKLVPKNYGDVEIIDSLNEIHRQDLSDSSQNTTVDPSDVYPWIAAIFLKNDSMKNQFEYYCDGALLNNNVLITAARCVHVNNSTVDPNDVLVILGKRSLLTMDQRERAVKIKQIIPHENFTNANGKVVNDLAILVLDDTIYFNEVIQSANIGNDTRDVERLVTTAWDQQGDIVPVYLDDKENQACNSRDAGKSMFCATYGLDVALCPSYGGIFAAKQEDFWFLYGIRSGDTTDRGVCIDKHVWFTDLREYQGWIGEYL